MTLTRIFAALFVFVLACSNAQACTTASSAMVQKVFKESVRLNEVFKKSVDGPGETEYRGLRKQVESYEESRAIPCLKRAVVLMRQGPDASLMDALFAHAFSHENSADETESEVLATVFVLRGEAFMVAWKKSSAEARRTLATRVTSGWELTKKRYSSAKRQQIESRLKRLDFR